MRKTIALTIAVLFAGMTIISAQTPTIQSPTGGQYSEWSSDSQLFVYQNIGKDFPNVTRTASDVFMAAPYWEAFNPQTGGLVESSVWPLYPNLSAMEKRVFHTEGFISTSLDGAILVYPSLKGKVTIANRTTQEIFETSIDYLAPDHSPIVWSDDDQSIVIEGAGVSAYEFDPILYYLHLVDREDLSQTQIYSVGLIEPALMAGNRIFTPVDSNKVFDVHEHQVLTTMSDLTNFRKAEFSTNEAQSYLVIWNPEAPKANTIIDAFNGSNVKDAAFVPNNPQRILVILGNSQVELRFILKAGIYTYNIQTQEVQFLLPLNQYNADSTFSYFSPDGNWLALRVQETGRYAFFRTSDLLSIPPLAAPTAFPTFTPVPTYTPTDSTA